MKVNVFAVALLLGLSSAPASADEVDNPGNFVWDDGWGYLDFNQSSLVHRTLPASSGTIDMDLDSGGNITFNVFTIHSVSISPYTVLVQVVAANSSGKLDASIGGWNVTMSLELKIKITGNGLANTCVTPTFIRAFEGFYQYDAVTQEGEMELYSGNGGTTGWLTVPALITGCSSQESTINSLLGFGGAGQGLRVLRLRALTTPGPRGS